MKTLKQVKELLGDSFDTVGKTQTGAFIARKGFFYKMGKTTYGFTELVLEKLPDAVIIESVEVYKPFRGGSSIANQSHFKVMFRFIL